MDASSTQLAGPAARGREASSGHVPFAFIVGSPRSGTTILGRVLSGHPEIAQWYEPYFIWDWHLGNRSDDRRESSDLSPRHREFIRREFQVFLRKSGAKVLVDKSPRNCLKVPFVHAAFPEAKFIHIVRDGRAAILSIKREWERWAQMAKRGSVRGFYDLASTTLGRQPHWRNRFQAIAYELKNRSSINPLHFFRRPKWGGRTGWGSRFPGWQEALDNHSLLAFNALQWVNAVETILADAGKIPESNWLEVRYERLVSDPGTELDRILDFLSAAPTQTDRLGKDLFRTSMDKWRRDFGTDELDEIHPIIEATMEKLGYFPDDAL